MFRTGGGLHSGEVVEHHNRAMRVLGGVVVAALTWMVFVNAWTQPTMTTVVLAVAVWCTGSFAASRLLLRPSVRVDDAGISVSNPFREHRVDWSDVMAITHRNGPVRLHPRRGRPIPLWASVELAPIHGQHPHAERVARTLSCGLDAARLRRHPAPRGDR